MKRFYVLCLCFFCSLASMAQKNVESLDLYKDYSLVAPAIIDSTDVNGKQFELSSALKVPAFDGNYINRLTAETDGTFRFSNSDNKTRFVSLAFKMFVPKQEKIAFDIVSSAAFKADFVKASKDKKNAETDTTTIEAEYESGVYDMRITLMIEEGESTLQIICKSESAEIKFSDSKQALTLESMLCGRTLYSVDLSPSASYYLLKFYDRDNGGKNTWTWQLKSTKDDKLLKESGSNFGLAWLPKSDLLYYTKKINGRNSLVIFDPKTLSEEVIAKDIPEGGITFLNNEQGFIISIKETSTQKKEDVYRLLAPDDRISDQWRKRSDLYLYRLGDGSLQRLTYSHHNVYLCDIRKDDKKALISVSYEKMTERPFGYNVFYELDLQTLVLDSLFKDSFVSNAAYFNDSLILLHSSCEAFNSVSAKVKKNQIPNIYNNTVIAYNLKSKAPIPVLKDFNPSVNSFDVQGDKVVMLCTDKDSVNVYTLLPNEDFRIEKQNLPCDIISDYTCTPNSSYALFIGQNYNKPDRLFEIENGNCKEIYFPKQKEYAQLDLGKMEVWNNETKTGLIEGRYYLPSDFDANKKYPLIVYYYGGTTPTDRAFAFRYSPYLYTARGFVVYVLNPSGTIGYGQEFAARHVNAWGDKTADEIIKCVKDFCKTHSFVDAEKIGCMGASYGGFMTQYLITKTDIFAAAISHAGISNITSYWGEGYWGYGYSAAASAFSYPWNAPKLYTEHSPLFNADKINTPLLLLHGTSDTNVPVGESIQMYNALKILGKDVQFVNVKGEDHGIVEHKKRMQWNNTIFAWFDKYLKGDSSLWNQIYPETELEK